ncbi:MAG: FKBP-type peptidyl-prolyl cis-trans isomerase [Patescibacteria group bacterium]
MKTLIIILLTIITIFVLLFVAKAIFGFKLKFEKVKEELTQENIMPEENKITENNQENSEQAIQEITELSAQILKQGSGDRQVQPGDKITVHYTGMLLDGTKFDSSIDRGEPFGLTIGAGQVIQGWEQGIPGMKIGEQRRLFIPSELAYGAQGAGNLIGPNADLVFDVELISIDK